MLRLLIEACVHRRVAAFFATLVVAAFGLHAYLETPIEAYPDVTNTQVTVITQLPGNAPEEISEEEFQDWYAALQPQVEELRLKY